MMVHELGGRASQPNIRPIPLFKILKGTGHGERIAEFPAFWACARHANCRSEVRIAKNCPRIATRIAKLASELPPELPGGACESPAKLGLLSVSSNGHMTRSDRAHARIAKSCPRVATRIATLAQSSCYPSCQAVHARSQLNWVAVCTFE